MEEENKKIRFRNDGKKYVGVLIAHDFISPKFQGNFVKGVAMFRIMDEYEKEILGCVAFTENMLIDSTWAQPHMRHFPSNYRDEALVNLLHYLPLNLEKLKKTYPECYEFRFDRDFGQEGEEDFLYRIIASDSFEATFQKIIFGVEITNRKIQDSSLEIMFNHWEDNPDTNVLVEMLVNVLPVSEVNVIKNLKLLLNEGKIHAVTSPSDPQMLISVGLEPSIIRILDGEVKTEVEYPQMVKQVFGTNIENLTTHGDNSPININIGDIDTAFGGITKQIKEKEFPEKEQVLKLVEELKTELSSNKNPQKIRGFIDKIKDKAVWVYNLIMANPILTAYLTQLLLQTLPISSTK